jgi:hypothetical protein
VGGVFVATKVSFKTSETRYVKPFNRHNKKKGTTNERKEKKKLIKTMCKIKSR